METKSSHSFSRRCFLQFSAAGLAMVALSHMSGCGSSRPLRVAVQPWCGYQFLFLAQHEGLLSESEITLIETKSNFESISALKNGLADVAPLTLDEVLYQRDQGFEVSIVAVLDVSAGADVLLVQPHITALADLKGRHIGVENTALGTLMLGKTLEAAKLQSNDVVAVKIEEDHMAAWQRGGLEAIFTYEPFLSELKKKGLVQLLDSRQIPQTILDVMAVPTHLMKGFDTQLRTLLKGHFNAINLWLTNPAHAQYYLSERLRVKPEEVFKVYSGVDLPDLTYNKRYLSPPANELNETVRGIARILQGEGMLKRPVDFNGLLVSDYLPTELA